jgi:hydroxyacylglutathione hydrolase
MRITDQIHLVGSGATGFGMTDPFDCHVYLLDGGGELALVDAGAGMGAEAIVENIRRAGLDPAAVTQLLLTHGNGDHAGGTARLSALLGGQVRVSASPGVRRWLTDGDEAVVSLDVAREQGIYPADYRLEACAVDGELREGEPVTVGNLRLAVLETPGHCRGHLSFLVEAGGRRDLLAGDAVFHGGRIHLQPIHDCDLQEQVTTLRRLRGLAVDGLFAGHGQLAVNDGQEQIERANLALDALTLPPPLVPSA